MALYVSALVEIRITVTVITLPNGLQRRNGEERNDCLYNDRDN